MAIVTLENSYLQGLGKRGELKRDDKGYTWLCVGAFNVFNNIGEFYNFGQTVKNQFEGNSDFAMLTRQGKMKGEWEHPRFDPNWNKAQVLARANQVDPRLVSHHMHSFKLEPGKDEHGNACILVMSRIKESGLKASEFGAMIDNSEENICFSIRGYSKPVPLPNGKPGGKLMTHIITYDHTYNGGVSVATKYDSPTMESANKFQITEHDVDRYEELMLTNPLTMESCSTTAKMLRTNLGWQKIEVVSPLSMRL